MTRTPRSGPRARTSRVRTPPDQAGTARTAHAPPEDAPAADPAPATGIRIEVAPELIGGLLYGRQDTSLRGRVIAPAPITAVSLSVAGQELGELRYPIAHEAAAPAGPEPPCTQSFAFTIARPSAAAAPGFGFSLSAHTADGRSCRADFTARHDPNGEPGQLASGPSWAAADPAPAAPVIGYVERAALDPSGNLVVNGWAVAAAPVVAVQALLGGARVGSAVLGGTRDDVAAYYGQYPNAARAGFAMAMPLGPATGGGSLAVHVIAADGAGLQMVVPLERPSRIDLPPPAAAAPAAAAGSGGLSAERRRIHMFCDVAELRDDGTLSLSGWAVSAVGIAAVAVLMDDAPLGEAETGLPRPDVAETFVTVPMARYPGFTFATAVALPVSAESRVKLLIRNGLGDVEEVWIAPERTTSSVAAAGDPALNDPSRFRLEIDRPILVDGIMVEPVSSRLTIEGWALSRSPLAEIAVYVDGHRRGEAHYGLARQDVEQALPDWPNALRSGFAYHCPPRLLRNGDHRVELVLRADDGTSLTRGFRISVNRSIADDEGQTIRNRIEQSEGMALGRALARLDARPSFRLLIRDAGSAAPEALAATLASLRAQTAVAAGPTGCHVELLAGDAAAATRLRRALAAAGADILHVSVAAPAGTARTETAAWPPPAVADQVLCGVLAAGDELDAAALAELALARALHPDTEFLYADEVRISPASQQREPFFKPDFAPALLLSTNYIGRPWLATAGLLRRAGASLRGILAAGEYDLVLRCTEQANRVGHLPKLLCRRGAATQDDAPAERAALAAAAARRGIDARLQEGRAPGTWRLRRQVGETGLVSIIIPTNGAGGHVETCIRTLRARTRHRNFELVCIENIPDRRAPLRGFLRDHADVVVAAPAAFNWSRFNNLAAAKARGAYLLFLNDDIEVEQDDWLDAMLEQAADPGVGVVGARLLYPDRTVQHAGMFLAGAGTGRHAFRFAADDDPGYFGLSLTTREVSAVTGACMLMRRTHYDALGGFDEAHEVINNDLDFCLRTAAAGRRVVYTPHACLIHHELASRGGLGEVFDTAGFEERWRARFAAGDPFHNPNLSTEHDDCRPNDEPLRLVHGGGARFAREDIRSILAVKVDHIGDFVSALPAIRRLKESFPAAAIRVLASPAAVQLAAMEPAIAEVIPFGFFHARSALGRAALDPAEFDALRARLSPYRFDLAIDLRKHLDTRELLQCSGARWLAGFDHMGQFPWLDIALEWEGDRALHPKRQHITEDLLRLADAVALGAGTGASRAVRPAAATPLPPALGALFDRPVICIHPGAGNVMKEWPREHYLALISLLLKAHPVNVVLIGGPDEAGTAAWLEASAADPARIGSIAGRLQLDALPGLLARCALFIGNDSGPKHIAAALGVPTVGIHSGTVDPTEWGPVGQDAVAVARAMSCAPCYLNRETDCPRALACIRGIAPGAVYRVCQPLLAPFGGLAAPPARNAAARPARTTAGRHARPAPASRAAKRVGAPTNRPVETTP
ncbi:MAG: glycosyltransferase [Rhodospirillales bacterium]|nr:glycosyltransferase [Rhodospirillales bacterium]